MRKILISILIVCLLLLSIYMLNNGIRIGKLEILGIKGILQKNDELDLKIKTAKIVAEEETSNAEVKLNQAHKTMNEKKAEYESLVAASTEEEVKKASQFLTYNVEFLWIKLGNHAKSEGVRIKIDFNENSTLEDNYDLEFTVIGSYKEVIDYIRTIEEDSSLGFKIENFSLIKGSDSQLSQTEGTEAASLLEVEKLIATFTCKNITVKGIEKNTTLEGGAEEIETSEGTKQDVENATNNKAANAE